MFLGHYAMALGARSRPEDFSWHPFSRRAVRRSALATPASPRYRACQDRSGETAVTPLDFYDYPFTQQSCGRPRLVNPRRGCVLCDQANNKGAIALGVVAFSHWVLDFLTHRPDLPLAFGEGPRFGLGLWDSVAGTVIVEVGLFFAGTALYAKTNACS